MAEIKRRLANLLAVKSIVTVILTLVFAYLAVMGQVTTEQFLTCLLYTSPSPRD